MNQKDIKKIKTPREVLAALIGTVEATGGIFQWPDGTYATVADPDWVDIADVYADACAVLERKSKVVKRPDWVAREREGCR